MRSGIGFRLLPRLRRLAIISLFSSFVVEPVSLTAETEGNVKREELVYMNGGLHTAVLPEVHDLVRNQRDEGGNDERTTSALDGG